ncbi:MAG TPA: DEAD/DEAH box helicase [Saprospiraceae bacterium]|nr:DEAD/DEAH box helicase [Saprospiraceae bacterium]HMQ84163.1 DEAD/DEAH box helicase [Saprospiraceae bacterium]
MKFEAFNFETSLMEGLDAMGFKETTPIQEKAIPVILEGKDVLAIAQTGTGKTAAFLLPVINQLVANPTKGIKVLIVEPTRELAMQVDQQLEAFSYFCGISSMAIYGGRDGQSMEQERKALKEGAAIIVATPGRLISHIDLGYVDFSQLDFLILDEADRMLDMGFAPAIMNIVHKLPRKRQTLLFSATMPSLIRQFAKQLLQKPVEISIAISKPAENVLQAAYFVEDEAKMLLAKKVLEFNQKANRILIFSGTKKVVRDLDRLLTQSGMAVSSIHSDLSQEEREERLLAFKNGSSPIMVATDVLSRGIDISGIDVVINYDVPGDAEDYVHRIGRTARANASGMALTFINSKDKKRFKRIEELIEMEVRKLPLPEGVPQLAPSKSKPDKTFQKRRASRPKNGKPRNKSTKSQS